MKRKKVLLIYTGGTIGMEKNYLTGSLQPFDFQNILEKIPELKLLDCEIEIYSFDPPLDSSDVGPAEWRQMTEVIDHRYRDVDGFVILHGTDTMSYSASALSFMLHHLDKPVIFTGSQLPIGDLRTDAKENLLTGIYYATLSDADGGPAVREVALYFEYKLLRGNRTVKFSAENFDAYQSPNYPILGQSGVRLSLYQENLWCQKTNEDFFVDYHFNTTIGLLRIFPGMRLDILAAYHNYKVLIIQVFGSGTIFNNEEIKKQLQALRQAGVQLIITSQCISGGVEFGKYANSNLFNEIGAISGGDMTVEAAMTKAMHLCQNPRYPDFEQAYLDSLRGERSF